MHLMVKNYFINSVLPTCLPWLWYISEAQASLNVPACQSALGFSERTSLEDGWRGCEADESGKVSPAPLSFSLCMASLSTCFRFHHCTLTASLHMDSNQISASLLTKIHSISSRSTCVTSMYRKWHFFRCLSFLSSKCENVAHGFFMEKNS